MLPPRSRRIGTYAAALLLIGMASQADARSKSRPIRTGQMTCWNTTGNVIPCAGTGQDGDLQPGEPRFYVEKTDGTIRDKRTALSWERASDDGSIHDKDNAYSWSDAFGKIAALNAAAFAGYTDWRLPSVNELETIIDRGTFFPSVSPAFNTNCAPACTVFTCSCTVSASMIYWTSSSYVKAPQEAWLVNFFDGTTYVSSKTDTNRVRAVRGGS